MRQESTPTIFAMAFRSKSVYLSFLSCVPLNRPRVFFALVLFMFCFVVIAIFLV